MKKFVKKCWLSVPAAIMLASLATTSTYADAANGSFEVRIPGTYTDVDRKIVLDMINGYRKEAIENNYFNFKTNGYSYTPILWNDTLANEAAKRAAEASVFAEHETLDGKHPTAEVLAWNSDASAVGGINSWYGEKKYYLEHKSALDNWALGRPYPAEIGHYYALINPTNKYIGISSFKIDPSITTNPGSANGNPPWSAVAGELSKITVTDKPKWDLNNRLYTIDPSKIHDPSFKVSDLTNTAPKKIGLEDKATINATVKTEYKWGGDWISRLPVVSDKWVSSNTGVITVDKDGNLIPKAPGKAKLSLNLGDGLNTTTEIEVVAGHASINDLYPSLVPKKTQAVGELDNLQGFDSSVRDGYIKEINNATSDSAINDILAKAKKANEEAISNSGNIEAERQKANNEVTEYYLKHNLFDPTNPEVVKIFNEIESATNLKQLDEAVRDWKISIGVLKPTPPTTEPSTGDAGSGTSGGSGTTVNPGEGNPSAGGVGSSGSTDHGTEGSGESNPKPEGPGTAGGNQPGTPEHGSDGSTTAGTEHGNTSTNPAEKPGTDTPATGGEVTKPDTPKPGETTGGAGAETGKPSEKPTPGGTSGETSGTGTTGAESGKPGEATGGAGAETGKPGEKPAPGGTSGEASGTGTPGSESGKPGETTGGAGAETGKPGEKPAPGGTSGEASGTGTPGSESGKPGEATGGTGTETGKPGEKPAPGGTDESAIIADKIAALNKAFKEVKALTSADVLTANEFVEEYNRLHKLINKEELGPWARFENNTLENNGNKIKSNGLVAGYDQMVGSVRVGVIGSYSGGSLAYNTAQIPVDTNMKNGSVGAYAIYKNENFFVGSSVAYKQARFDDVKDINAVQTNLQTGYKIPLKGNLSFIPQIDFGYGKTDAKELNGKINSHYYGTTFNFDYAPSPGLHVVTSFGVHKVKFGNTALDVPNPVGKGMVAIPITARRDTWYNANVSVVRDVNKLFTFEGNIGYTKYEKTKLHGFNYGLNLNYKF